MNLDKFLSDIENDIEEADTLADIDFIKSQLFGVRRLVIASEPNTALARVALNKIKTTQSKALRKIHEVLI